MQEDSRFPSVHHGIEISRHVSVKALADQCSLEICPPVHTHTSLGQHSSIDGETSRLSFDSLSSTVKSTARWMVSAVGLPRQRDSDSDLSADQQ